MATITRRLSDRMEITAFVLPIILYISIVIPVAIRQQAAINPDGIIYIRKAQFLLAGHFWQSASGYWSPAISWCTALVIRIFRDIDPLHAIHGVLAFWGMTWVIASCALLRSLLPTRACWRLLAGIAIAFVGVRQAVSLITPDLLLGTMLIAYLTAVSSTGLLSKRRTAFCCGIYAGLGYLCKSYALPFFCLHFPMTVAYRYWRERAGMAWNAQAHIMHVEHRRIVAIFLFGVIGFALPALPWVGLLSHKYGHFTISMVYHHNHMNVAAQSVQEGLPDFCVLPPDPYLSIWEGLDPGPRLDWSPFSSWRNFLHQLSIGVNHSWLIISNVANFDSVGLVLLAGVVAFVPFKLLKRHQAFSPVPVWIVLTSLIYCLGFLIVAFEVRYIVPILLPLGMALCLREWDELFGAATDQPSIVLLLPFLSMVMFVISAFIGMKQFAFDSPARPIYANVAATLKQQHLDALFTSSDNNKGVNVSYYLNRKIVLIPFRLDIDTIQRELSAAGVTEALVWTDSRSDGPKAYPRVLAGSLLKSGLWRHAFGEKLDSVRRLDVYVLSAAAKSAAVPATDEADKN